MSDYLLPMYPNPPPGTVPSFHSDLNMSPQKAAKILMGNARGQKTKGKKGKMKMAAKTTGRMPSRGSGGARVFGGKK